MDESWITSSADDKINIRIWTESVVLQKFISAMESDPNVGAQQAMPKDEHRHQFSAKKPLPWVPDLVGPEFGKANPSVLIVGSSYNAFLDDYSSRQGTMPLADYVNARDTPTVKNGLTKFFASFIRGVVNDTAYYARIRRLLAKAEIPRTHVCITDLCKASFVQKAENNGARSDSGGDNLIKGHMEQWQCYVLGAPNENPNTAPLPYQWLGERIEKAQIILALGKLAEYGVIKVLKRQAPGLRIKTHQFPYRQPNQVSLESGRNWAYESAMLGRTVNSWLQPGDWWNLDDPDLGKSRQLLPCVHPGAWRVQEQEDNYVQKYTCLLRIMAAVRSSCPDRRVKSRAWKPAT